MLPNEKRKEEITLASQASITSPQKIVWEEKTAFIKF